MEPISVNVNTSSWCQGEVVLAMTARRATSYKLLDRAEQRNEGL